MRVEAVVDGDMIEADLEPRTLLVQWLRDLGRTGTKVGCDTSTCGACTVLVDGVAIKSCTRLAVQADGRSVTTVHGLTPADRLSPVQEAFSAEHGLQCGFCTPGFIVAVTRLLEDHPDPSEEEIVYALDGNLCRCTGYSNIIRAVMRAARARQGMPLPEPSAGSGHAEPLRRHDAGPTAVEEDLGGEIV